MLESHIEDCESCRAELKETRNAIALLREVPDVEPPSDLLHRIHEEIEMEGRASTVAEAKVDKPSRSDVEDASSNIIWAI